MPWYAVPLGVRGAQSVYSDAAIEALLTVKVLFGPPFRQMTGFVTSLVNLAGLDMVVPDYSKLCWRQKTLAMQLPPGARTDRWICWPTAWGSRSEANAIGMHAGTEERSAARVATST